MAIRQRKKRKLGFRRADGKCGGFLNYFFSSCRHRLQKVPRVHLPSSAYWIYERRFF